MELFKNLQFLQIRDSVGDFVKNPCFTKNS